MIFYTKSRQKRQVLFFVFYHYFKQISACYFLRVHHFLKRQIMGTGLRTLRTERLHVFLRPSLPPLVRLAGMKVACLLLKMVTIMLTAFQIYINFMKFSSHGKNQYENKKWDRQPGHGRCHRVFLAWQRSV